MLRSVHKIIYNGILIAVIFTLLSILIVYELVSITMKPLAVLSKAANSVSKGEYPDEVPVSSKDEIGTLTEEFNRMSSTIKERELSLTQKNNELEQFAYIVSHDLKSPLLTIRGFVGLMNRHIEKESTDGFKEYIDYICSAADRMYELLDEVLKISRLGYYTIKKETVSLDQILKETLKMFATKIAKQNITIVTPPPLGIVQGDNIRLLEVFQNLIDNAIKFMRTNISPVIEIGVIKKNNKTVYYVKDNGIGIKRRYKERIFRIFDRLNPGAEGTGVGLTIVKQIIEKHNGRIWIESSGENEGSTFYFTLWEQKTANIKKGA